VALAERLKNLLERPRLRFLDAVLAQIHAEGAKRWAMKGNDIGGGKAHGQVPPL